MKIEFPPRFGEPIIKKENFWNRENEIEQILKMVGEVGQNIALLGDRRVGKTSIINYVMEEFKKVGNIVAYTDLSRVRPVQGESKEQRLSRLLLLLLEEIITSYSRAIEKPAILAKAKETLRTLTFRKATTPLDFKVFKIPVDVVRDTDKLLQRTFELPNEIAHKLRSRFILFLDEFQFLSEFGMNVLWVVRSIKSKQENVTYVVSGSRHTFMRELLGSESSPFFGFFQTISVEKFDKERTEQYVRYLCSKTPYRIEDAATRKVYVITKGNPTYINWLMTQVILDRIKTSNPSISSATVENVFDENINTLTMLMLPEWNRLSPSEQEIMKVIATHDISQTTAIAKRLRVSLDRVTPYIKFLIDKEILVRTKRGQIAVIEPNVLKMDRKNPKMTIE